MAAFPIQTDANGFIIVAGSPQQVSQMIRTWTDIRDELMLIRTILQGGAASVGGSPSGGGASPPPAPAGRPRPPSLNNQNRGADGRFGGDGSANRADQNRTEAETERRESKLRQAIERVGDAVGSVDDVDPMIVAAKEIGGVIQPFRRVFARGEKQGKEQTGWLKKIWNALTSAPPPPAPGGAGAGGLIGMLSAGRAAIVGAAAAAAPVVGAAIGTLIKRTPVIAGLYQAVRGVRDDQRIQDAGGNGLDRAAGAGRSAARLAGVVGGALAGGKGGAVAGTLIGGPVGTIIGGAIGAGIGAIAGPMAVDGITNALTPVATSASMYFSDATDWVKSLYQEVVGWIRGKVVDPVKRKYEEAKAFVAPAVGAVRSGAAKVSDALFGGGNIQGLSAGQSAAYMKALAKRESGGNPMAVNDFGYSGLYQMGASALSDVGLIDRGKLDAARNLAKRDGVNFDVVRQKAFLADPSNWRDGMSQQAFLKNPELQTQKAIEFNNQNIRAEMARKGGALSANSTQSDIGGFAMGAWLKGRGAARKVMQGGADSRDGYGTSTSSYVSLGRSAVINAPTIPAIPTRTMPNIAAKPAAQAPLMAAANTFAAGTAPAPLNIPQDISDRLLAHIATGGVGQGKS